MTHTIGKVTINNRPHIEAITFDGRRLNSVVDNVYAAEHLYSELVECRDTISRYRTLTVYDECGKVRERFYGIPKDEAMAFYATCHKIWHDGAVSASHVASTLEHMFNEAWWDWAVDHMCDACIAWGLPVDRANGMWVF